LKNTIAVADHLSAGLFLCSANACATLSASEGVPANKTFDMTATPSPRSENVSKDATSSTPQMAIVTSRLNRLTGQRYGLEIPA
jgi:hypothetical protein